jgi:molybdenum cofactor cytidylyltransferase
MGVGLELKTPSEGRASLKAKYRGVVKIDEARLEGINRCEGIAFASLPSYQVVNAGQTVANVKIIPYGIPEKVIGQALEAAKGEGAVIENYELQPLPVGILYSGEPAAQNRIVHTFDLPLRQRVESCGSLVTTVDFVRMDSSQDTTLLASALRCQVEAGVKMIIMASETSIMDVEDIAPSAVVQAGGEVVSVGAPVDPGNLMMIAYLGDVPILGVPGCARSPKKNVIDQVLPALLSGERLTRADIARLGYGGLLSA